MVASAVPSPAVKVSPPVPDKVMPPLVTARVTCTVAASTSATLMRLPLAAENTRAVSSLVVCAAGTVFTGASFTAVTVTVAVCDVLFTLSLARATTVTDRSVVVGASLVLLYWTPRRIVW